MVRMLTAWTYRGVDIDPLAGKTDIGQKGLHDGTGNTKQRNGSKSHGDNKERLVMVSLFHEEAPEEYAVI